MIAASTGMFDVSNTSSKHGFRLEANFNYPAERHSADKDYETVFGR